MRNFLCLRGKGVFAPFETQQQFLFVMIGHIEDGYPKPLLALVMI
jgi:hypothetical protein